MNFTLRKCWMHFHLQFDQFNMILSQLERGSGSILPRRHIFARLNCSLIQIILLEALSLHAQGRIPEALDRYLQCLSLARPERYLATFLDEGTPAAQLLDLFKSQELEQPMRDSVGILVEALSKAVGAAQAVTVAR
jgi:hypothetical protein